VTTRRQQPSSHRDAALRRATHADVPAIAEFQTRSWQVAYRDLVGQDYLDRISVEVRQARWHERLDTGAREIALATIDGTVVGVVSWAHSGEPGTPGLELKSLYVDAGQHGTGLAAALTGYAIGDSPAFLWVFEQNPRAGRSTASCASAPTAAARSTRTPTSGS
jgi:hypothetical protein